jgi:hypothetical protein
MADLMIGFKNVPNVYICKINLEDHSTNSYSTEMDLKILDTDDGNKFEWSDNKAYYDFLRVAVITTDNQRLSDSIKNGVISPTLKNIRKSPYYSEKTKVEIIPISQFRKVESAGKKMFMKKLSTVILNDQKDLYVYAYCFIDTVGLSNYFKINLEGHFKEYLGAVTSEIIIKNGNVADYSFIFLRSDNGVYGGPVHSHDGQFMIGPVHTQEAHESLRRMPIRNIKLSDNRTISRTLRVAEDQDPIEFLSDLYYSINKSTNLVGMFLLDMRQLVLQKTKHGKAIMGVGDKIFKEFMETVEINSMSIRRQQVELTRSSTRAGTPKLGVKKLYSYQYVAASADATANNLNQTDNLKQIYLNEGIYNRAYQFLDSSKVFTTSGDYTYRVEITVNDKSEKFINKRINQISSWITKLKDIVHFLSIKSNFDYDTNMLKRGVSAPEAIEDCIRAYYDNLSYISDFDEEVADLVHNRTLLFVRENYKQKYGQSLLKDFNELSTYFRKKFGVFKEYNSRSPKTIKVNKIPGIIKVSKNFSDVITFREFHRSYQYFDFPEKSDRDLMALSFTEMQQRGYLENDRFFTSDFALNGEEFKSLDGDVVRSIEDLESSRLTYLSPLVFTADGIENSVEDLASIDTEGLNAKFLASQDLHLKIRWTKKSRRPRKRRRNVSKSMRKMKSKKSLSRSTLRVPRRKKFKLPSMSIRKISVPKLYEENSSPYVSSSFSLGPQSHFVPGKEEYQPPVEDELMSSIKMSIKTATKIQSSRNKLNFDINEDKNFLSRFMSSKKFSMSKLAKTPNHFKALIASRAEGVRNDLLESENDMLIDPNTRVATEMLFQATQQIQVLVDYQTDSYGNKIISRPIWVPMEANMIDESTTAICRLVYTEHPEIGMVPSEQFMLPVQDSVFIISGDDLTVNKQEVYVPDRVDSRFSRNNELSKAVMYSTNNIVTQKESKNPIINNSKAVVVSRGTMSTPAPTTQVMDNTGVSTPSGGGSY